MKSRGLTSALFAGVVAATLLGSLAPAAVAQGPAHIIENFGSAKWGPAPPMLPPGAQIAVLAGDPTKAAPYAVRLRFPASYDVPAHSHPRTRTSWSSQVSFSWAWGTVWTGRTEWAWGPEDSP